MVSDDDVVRSIGLQLAHLRTERRRTLQSVAGELGVSYQQLKKYETGVNRISASTLYRLACILRVPPHVFFHEVQASDGRRAQAGADRAAGLDAESEDALAHIQDERVRLAMRELLAALETHRRPGPFEATRSDASVA